jgi:hypothetical protein
MILRWEPTWVAPNPKLPSPCNHPFSSLIRWFYVWGNPLSSPWISTSET